MKATRVVIIFELLIASSQPMGRRNLARFSQLEVDKWHESNKATAPLPLDMHARLGSRRYRSRAIRLTECWLGAGSAGDYLFFMPLMNARAYLGSKIKHGILSHCLILIPSRGLFFSGKPPHASPSFISQGKKTQALPIV